MKLTVFLLLLTVLSGWAVEAYSQSTRLTVKMEKSSIEEVLLNIENQSEYRFFYNGIIDVDKQVSINCEDKLITDVLKEIFNGTDIQYKVMGRQISLSSDNQFINGAPNQIITGKVTDTSGGALPGVTVIVKGTTMGTVTDGNGNYSITEVPADASLVFSFVGMKTIEIVISGKTQISVVMVEDAIGLEEVIAVGYGTMKKSDLTGAVASVKSEDMMAYPASGAVQSLQGRTAGLQVQATNGEPGSGYRVRVRGANSMNSSSDPLFVVDGFPGAAMPPSEDIESVEVLKDASATAIYGSRGSNGVILISTKRGKVGKTKIEFNSSYSVQKEIGRFDLLQTPDFIKYINEISPGRLDPNASYPNTDWQDLVLKNGALQNYQLSFLGGNENVKYYVSGIVYDNDGVIINSDFKRYSLTSNLDLNISKNLKVGIDLYVSKWANNGVNTQEGSGGAGNTGVMSGALKMAPTVGVYNDDGSYTLANFGDPHDNPFAVATERTNEGVGETLQGNFFAELHLFTGLTFKSTFGVNSYSGRTGTYVPTTLNAGKQVLGDGTIDASRNLELLNENYFTYRKTINDVHDLTFMAGYSNQSSRNESWFAQSQNFITDAFTYWDLDGGSVPKNPRSGLVESVLSSYYGRMNYKLFDRYLITLNARYDGSSRFAKNNKWAFFPSGAIAWNVAEEEFMKKIPQISQFKLRGSYGVTGNQAIGPYQSLAKLGTVPKTIINNTLVNAVAPSTVANDNLTWESTAQTDIGVDVGFLNQRISLVADYYYKKTSDLLFSMPLPEYSGYSSLLKNIGSIENRGFEFTLTTVNFEGDFKWTTDINFSRNRNKILELPDGNDIFRASGPGHMVGIGDTQIFREGEPMGQFYGFVYDGVYQEGDTFLTGGSFEKVAGGEKFRDLNDDGKLANGDDRTIIGDPNPDFIWGLNNQFEYKGFDLNIFFQGSQGNDIYSFTLFEMELLSGMQNVTTRALDRWTPTHTNTDVPKATDSRPRFSSSRFVYDGSYVRLKNLSLGYKIPNSLVSRIGIGSARIYISGQNILTFTKYPGIDPEVSWLSGGAAGGNMNLGLDYGSYPNSKSYTVGIQVKF